MPIKAGQFARALWEWVEDNYDMESKVLRGGGWGSGPGSLRVSNRNWLGPSARFDDIGFRCVWECLSLTMIERFVREYQQVERTEPW